MFQHAMVTGWNEYKCTIWCGQREPLPGWDLLAEPTAMELIGPDSTHQDISELYWNIYQLSKLPRQGRSEEATEKQIHQEVLDAIAGWHPPACPCTAFTAMDHGMYEKFTAANCGMYEEIMALTRDAHQWALVAAGILEEQMERMSHSKGCQCSISYQNSSSCWCSSSWQHSASHRRSWSLGWQEESPKVTSHQGGVLLKNKLGHPAPQGGVIRWPLLKGEHPHQRVAQNVTLRQMWPTSCPCRCGGLRGITQRGQLAETKGRGWDYPSKGRSDLECSLP